MTAEEILNEHDYDVHYYGSGKLNIINAMSEYAKQEAIAFSEWNCINLWCVVNGLWYPYQDNDNPITGEELYNLYLQSKQK